MCIRDSVNFARARRLRQRTRAPGGLAPPVPPHAAAGVPSGPADFESDTKYCKMQIGWAGGQKFFSKPYFFRAKLEPARHNKKPEGHKVFFLV